MSPFYLKEGENWKKWDRFPMDLKVGKEIDGVSIPKASILPVDDEEKVAVFTDKPIIGIVEEGHGVIFPGEHTVINRRGIIFENLKDGTKVVLVHSEEEIK